MLWKETQDFSIELSEGMYDEYFINTGEVTLQNIEDRADMVVTVEVLDEREMGQYSTNTKVVIDQVWKAKEKNIKEGKEIWIEEPATVLEEVFYETDGYQMMKKGEKYLLFLMHLPCIDGYQYSKKEEQTYTVVSEYYGKYCMTDEEQIKLFQNEEDKEKKYQDVEDYALLTEENSIVEQYAHLLHEVKEKYEKVEVS